MLEFFYQYTVSYTHTSSLWNGEWISRGLTNFTDVVFNPLLFFVSFKIDLDSLFGSVRQLKWCFLVLRSFILVLNHWV
ncbi:hypothetical protein QVD17_42392 [Tagetes erecta]|uniref:Uncharacterized protein n=1 Tax=Tagetes erecta TaxID=13708 RepID=A0AAD8NFA2_TARER|nr:hypothetical protein QVD17_42392 [Tagetes erecta]